ncbi:MAG TPA: EamA family transporter [Pyrinomonadaceae bacterium]|nr:EamA family transporter [Pyrinomonadaceae bacterium]
MKARLVWLILCGIWGSTWMFIKIGLNDLPPLSFAAIRFVIAAAILWVIVLFRRLKVPRSRKKLLLLASTGVLGFTVNYGLIFWGEQYISSGLAALLQSTIPAFGLLLAHLHLPAERMTPAKVVGVVLGVLGVAVIFSNQLSLAGPRAFAGSVAIVISAAGAAYSNVLIKAYGEKIEPTIIAATQMSFGLIPILLVGLIWEGNPLNFRWTGRALVSLLYLAIVGSVIAFILYYWLVQHMDVTKSMLIALVTPVTAVVLGMIVLGEQLDWRTLAGGVLVLSGIALVVIRRQKKAELEFASTG